MKDINQLIQKKESEENFLRRNVLEDLIAQIDKATGMIDLRGEVVIPQNEREDEFLWQTLSELGYSYTHREEYNPYHECYCYMITLSKK